jgi:Domain of unknown function (DUF4136)
MAQLRNRLALFAPLLALAALSGCATPFKAQVNRFQAMPAPQGQTFFVTAGDPARSGSLEFAQYAGLVSQKLQAVGYQPAASADAANLIVRFDYGVDAGKEKLRTVPGSSFGYGYPWGRWGYYGAGWSPWYPSYGFGRRGFVYGFHDPFLFGGGFDQVESYTVYTSSLTMNIERKGDGQRVFEGSAKAMSRDDNLTQLVPNLVEAIFTGFPGNSGETVKITVAPPEKR